MPNRPNILYLHSHDTGRSVRPYGHDMQTPATQRLAEDGLEFRQAFAAAPTCSPPRAALLTGRFADETGMTGLAHSPHQDGASLEHLVRAGSRADVGSPS